jgi:hypothetical protein
MIQVELLEFWSSAEFCDAIGLVINVHDSIIDEGRVRLLSRRTSLAGDFGFLPNFVTRSDRSSKIRFDPYAHAVSATFPCSTGPMADLLLPFGDRTETVA